MFNFEQLLYLWKDLLFLAYDISKFTGLYEFIELLLKVYVYIKRLFLWYKTHKIGFDIY